MSPPPPAPVVHPWLEGVLRLVRRDTPADVEAEYLRNLYGNFVFHGPLCIVAALYLYAAAPDFGPDSLLPAWMGWFVAYHALRTALGLAYTRRRSPRDARQVELWGLLSLPLHLAGGLLLLVLALGIYPFIDDVARHTLLSVVLVIVGTSAFTLAGRWAEIALYAPAIYLGFAWATWPLPHPYARSVAVLILLFFALYLIQARNQHRVNLQSFALARRNGELAAELRIKNAELQEVASARSRLLATVSHDLRQPSHAIGLLCERALLESNPAELRQSLHALNELSESLSASLTTLMNLTRLDAGLVEANPGPVPVGPVLLRLDAEFSALAKNRGLQLTVPGSHLWVHSDPVLLHGVLANLVSNAIKYTRAGQVALELQAQGQELTVSVRDTGIGIRAEKLELIFKEFVRLDGGESGTEGLGLGLAIVRRYAALLGHTLAVTSEPGRGSCFSIRLPLVQAPPSTASAGLQALAERDTRLAGLRVLVVDNVDIVLTSMVRTLQGWGCQTHAAPTLAAARRIAEQHRLDLIISDYHLGDAEPNGLELIAALRQLPSQGPSLLPAWLMTGDVSSQLDAQARQCQVGVLHKPVRPAVLQDRLLRLVAADAFLEGRGA